MSCEWQVASGKEELEERLAWFVKFVVKRMIPDAWQGNR